MWFWHFMGIVNEIHPQKCCNSKLCYRYNKLVHHILLSLFGKAKQFYISKTEGYYSINPMLQTGNNSIRKYDTPPILIRANMLYQQSSIHYFQFLIPFLDVSTVPSGKAQRQLPWGKVRVTEGPQLW